MNQRYTLIDHRRRLSLERIRESGVVKTSELSELFVVSPMIIRNDLNTLADQGHLMRTHGGALAKQPPGLDLPYDQKTVVNKEEKRRIGKKAVALIEDGMAVFIGNGSTTMQIVQGLTGKQRVKVYTDSLNHALEISRVPHVELYVVGGYLRGVSYAMIGPSVQRSLDGLYFDILFLGVDGISLEAGLTLPSPEEAETAALMLSKANRKVIVADHSKFGKISHGRITGLSDVDMIITDSKLERQRYKELRDLDVELLIV